MLLFSDLRARAEETLSEGYVYANRIRVQTLNDAGWTWTGQAEVFTSFQARNKAFLSAAFGLPAEHAAGGIQVEEVSVSTDGRLRARASCPVTRSLSVRTEVEDGRQEPGKALYSFGRVAAVYAAPALSGVAEVDIVNGPSLYSSLVAGVTGGGGKAVAGAEMRFNTRLDERRNAPPASSAGDAALSAAAAAAAGGVPTPHTPPGPEVTDYNFGLGYIARRWQAVFSTSERASVMGLTYAQDVSNRLKLAAQLNYRLDSTSQDMQLGAVYDMGDGGTMRGKISSSGLASLSLTQRLRQGVDLTLCAELASQDLESDAHKFGMTLAFENS